MAERFCKHLQDQLAVTKEANKLKKKAAMKMPEDTTMVETEESSVSDIDNSD
eukprot:gene3260-1587_t